MTRPEFSMLAAALRTFYSRETNLLPNDQAMELWYNQLEDIPYHVLEAALKKWVATNRWSPSIADLRELSAGIKYGEIPDWGQAWKDVQHAITIFGWYHQKEAMESLSGITKETVERMGFGYLCLSEDPEIDMANFRKIYEELAKRKKNDDMIPDQLKNVISGITKKQLEQR